MWAKVAVDQRQRQRQMEERDRREYLCNDVLDLSVSLFLSLSVCLSVCLCEAMKE